MKMISQTLSLMGMLAVAVLIVVLYRGFIVDVEAFSLLRVIGVLIFAVACFWGAARVKGKG